LPAKTPSAFSLSYQTTTIITKIGIKHPIAAPNSRCRPDLVKRMPICLLSLALAKEIPRSLFQENRLCSWRGSHYLKAVILFIHLQPEIDMISGAIRKIRFDK
jgi:hypothetical protein